MFWGESKMLAIFGFFQSAFNLACYVAKNVSFFKENLLEFSNRRNNSIYEKIIAEIMGDIVTIWFSNMLDRAGIPFTVQFSGLANN